MKQRRRLTLGTVLGLGCAIILAGRASATGVPVGGFLPLVGIGLSNEYEKVEFDLSAHYHTAQPTAGIMLGNGTPQFDVALFDSGANFSAITAAAYSSFNIDGPYAGNSDGFAGTEQLTFNGATGSLTADVNEPLGLYAAGVQNRAGGPSFAMNLNLMTGQTNTSTMTFPVGSDLPNVVGLPFAMRYATFIHNDQPQIFQVERKTVRAPAIEFFARGSGISQGITRRAFLDPNPSSGFSEQSPPTYLFNLSNLDINQPWKDPSYPTLLSSGNGGTFLTVSGKENGNQLGNSQFLFDTGADVTVVSALSANQLGYNGIPDFTVAVVGSGGTFFDVPGFFLDDLTVLAENATNHGVDNLLLHQVPVIILNVVSPVGGTLPGIIGTNVIAGRNAVFDPIPTGEIAGVDPGLFISDPITTEKNWTTTAASGNFATGGNWSGGSAPDLVTNKGIANVRHVSGGNQTAVVSANAQVWELNVSGTANQTMTVQVQSGVTLLTYSGINIEIGGAVQLQNATLDAQYVEVFGGTLSGDGTILTGSGPIPGQVENRGGTVAPGNGIGSLNIAGRFASGPAATTAFELGGTGLGQYDQISVDGDVAISGTLSISLTGGFAPAVGNSFNLITIPVSSIGNLAGKYKQVLAPDGYNWRVNYTNTNIQLIVGNPGDFNNDGNVTAADYVVWRKTGLGPLNYDAWRTHFGANYGSGAAAGATVPEPACCVLLIAAGFFALSRKCVIRPARYAASIGYGASCST
jgi:hypothetical protein